MKVQSGIELVYHGRNRRDDLRKAESFLDQLPLSIDFPQTVIETSRQATLGIRVARGDIIIRPVEGIVEYNGLESLPPSKYLVSFKQVGERDSLLCSGCNPFVTIWEKRSGGLHLNLYGIPNAKV